MAQPPPSPPNAFERLLTRIREGDDISLRVGSDLLLELSSDHAKMAEVDALADALHEGALVRIRAGKSAF